RRRATSTLGPAGSPAGSRHHEARNFGPCLLAGRTGPPPTLGSSLARSHRSRDRGAHEPDGTRGTAPARRWRSSRNAAPSSRGFRNGLEHAKEPIPVGMASLHHQPVRLGGQAPSLYGVVQEPPRPLDQLVQAAEVHHRAIGGAEDLAMLL